MIVEQFCGLSGIAAIVEWFKNIGSNEGVLMFAQGLGIMGLRAGISKKIETASSEIKK